MTGRVLIVEDDRDTARYVETALLAQRFTTRVVDSAEEALEVLDTEDFDVVVSDIRLPGRTGIDLCAQVVQKSPLVPVVVMTAFGSIELAVAATRAGAYDFVTKPVDIAALHLTIERALQHRELRDEVTRLRRAVEERNGFEELVGASRPMKQVYDLLERVGESEASVLITGESGTGKELVARALHRRSRRRERPFIAINCAAVPEPLLESELFGHARGAFTDARAVRPGLFTKASGGTLFLDELGDMPLGLQPKLLRALQEKTVRAVGADVEVPYDARVIAATNRDLETAIEEGRFRTDLFFRINVIHIELPSLRSRGGDVLLLAQRFLTQCALQSGKKVSGLSTAVAERLLAYDWPGNVRELQNCIERAVALTRTEEIAVDDLPERIRDHRSAHILVAGDDPADLAPLEEVERRYILRVLDAVGGNKSLASRVLKLDRKTLYRKLERYGVLEASDREEVTGLRRSITARPDSSRTPTDKPTARR